MNINNIFSYLGVKALQLKCLSQPVSTSVPSERGKHEELFDGMYTSSFRPVSGAVNKIDRGELKWGLS